MAFCGKCGTRVEEGAKFCPGCGAPVEAAAQQTQQPPQQENFGSKFAKLNNTADMTAEFDAQDVQNNKVMAILSYLGLLVLVPILSAKESRFARYHANQGLVLLIAGVAYGIVQSILMAILRAIFPWNWAYGYLGGRGAIYGILSTVLSLVWIVFSVLAIIGIINAVNGRAKELPVIGKFKLLK